MRLWKGSEQTHNLVTQLAREGNGAVQTEEATDPPIKVVLVGPIKYWWGKRPDGSDIWGTPEHERYTAWRDAMRVALVKTGVCAVYSPHRAIQGAWHEDLQKINDAAIMCCDIVVWLTPEDVPAEGTLAEVELARRHAKAIISAPPADDDRLRHIVSVVLRWVMIIRPEESA